MSRHQSAWQTHNKKANDSLGKVEGSNALVGKDKNTSIFIHERILDRVKSE
jgi:hypothetical protein